MRKELWSNSYWIFLLLTGKSGAFGAAAPALNCNNSFDHGPNPIRFIERTRALYKSPGCKLLATQ